MAQATNLSTTPAPDLHRPTPSAAVGTRRAFIGAIVGLPIVASSPTANAQTTDADLIDLGARFEPLIDQYFVARESWARSMLTAHVEYRASAEQYYPVLADCCVRSGADQALAVLSAIHQKMEELATAINAAPVHSIVGLRAKALVALWQIAPKHADDAEFSFECPSAFQQLFTAVAEVCGLNDKIAATGYRLPDVTRVDDDDAGGYDLV